MPLILNYDLYKILEIEKNADETTIKKAYREKAKLYHPDVNKNKKAKEVFLLVQEAYEVLHNPKTRMLYDRSRKDRSYKGINQTWNKQQNKTTYKSTYKPKPFTKAEKKRVVTISIVGIVFGIVLTISTAFNVYFYQAPPFLLLVSFGGIAIANEFYKDYKKNK